VLEVKNARRLYQSYDRNQYKSNIFVESILSIKFQAVTGIPTGAACPQGAFERALLFFELLCHEFVSDIRGTL
jgi:hypothetical protein